MHKIKQRYLIKLFYFTIFFKNEVKVNQNADLKDENYADTTVLLKHQNPITIRPPRQIMVTPMKGTEYGIDRNRTLTYDNTKTQRSMTKSVDLVKRDLRIDQSAMTENRVNVMPKIHSRMSTIQRQIPLFKENDDLSYLTGEDEWNEIEKYNAIAEKHDKLMKAIKIHTSQQKFQESLRKQIQEQRIIKQKQIIEEK